MSRVCELTGVRVMSGNNVSHSERKIRRRFLPNLHRVTIISDALGQKYKFRVTARALKSIEIYGGLDAYLLNTKQVKLSKEAQDIRKQLLKLEVKKG